MDSNKLKKRKRQADKPMRIFEELNRPVTYILDDVKAGFYFCDGIRSTSQNRHKLSLNRAIIQ